MKRALTLALVCSLAMGATPAPTLEGASGLALCQLSLDGVVGERPHPWVSISVTHRVEEELVETSLIGQFKPGTTGASLATLLAKRLKEQGARVTESTALDMTADLFIEDVTSVRVDLPAGPGASVTFCDRPLGVLSLRPTSPTPGAGRLEFRGVVSDVSGRHRSMESLEIPVIEGESGHEVCKRLFDRSLEAGWLPVREKTDRWSPSRRTDSRKLLSSEVKLSASGWELELRAG